MKYNQFVLSSFHKSWYET